jgi:hypothetical protein
MDLFEMDRVIEELARTFAAPCATTWFKVGGNKIPTIEEYREKVVSFMNTFEKAMYSEFSGPNDSSDLRIHLRNNLKDQIDSVVSGANKEVEKRYRYYVSHG